MYQYRCRHLRQIIHGTVAYLRRDWGLLDQQAEKINPKEHGRHDKYY